MWPEGLTCEGRGCDNMSVVLTFANARSTLIRQPVGPRGSKGAPGKSEGSEHLP
jgi:hypothetical protein